MALATIAVEREGERLFLHVMQPVGETPAREVAPGVDLTSRQLEVLELIAAGLRTTAIAERLGISVATVRNHIRAILIQLGAHSQVEALAAARRHGLLKA